MVTTNSHEVDAACKKGTDFAHEKDSGVKEATPLQIANWYADKWAKAYRKQESKDKRYSSARPKEVEEKCKWRLYHNDKMISGSMNKRLKEIVEQHHLKMYFQKKHTSNIIMQTRRKQQRPLGTQTGYKDTRNSGGSMDEQAR